MVDRRQECTAAALAGELGSASGSVASVAGEGCGVTAPAKDAQREAALDLRPMTE
jgi:hypothetical protein